MEKKKKKPQKGRALGDYTRRWDIMLAALEDVLQDLPQLQPYYNQLKSLLVKLLADDTEQEMMKGALKVLTAGIEETEKTGEKVYATIKKILENEYGKNAPEIAKFIPQASYEVDKTKEGFAVDNEVEKPPQEQKGE